MKKGLHKVFRGVLNELKNVWNNLVESGSEVSYFILEPRSFEEFKILPADFKKAWLKATLKEIKKLINNHTFIMDNT